MATEYLTTDIDLKKVADGIRSRTGKTTPLAFPDGYVTEISTLSNTSDATATASDIASGKTAYVNGAKVTGTIITVDDTSGQIWQDSKVTFTNGLNEVRLSRKNTFRDTLFRKGSTITLSALSSEFGNATAADVAKGKTFTSAAGLKVVGTAEGIAAEDVTFELYNNDFNDLAVVYMSKIDGVMQTTIPISANMPITASWGSMVALVNQDFNGDTIDLVPDNGEYIAQWWRTQNITLFVAGAETDGMNIDVNRT